MRKDYKCNIETHMKCENNVLCHLCDGISHYKNSSEEWAEKQQQKERNKQEKKNALLKTHSKEKKEGMGFEKRVANTWNSYMNRTIKSSEPTLKTFDKKKGKVGKPRLDLSEAMDEAPEEKPEPVVSRPVITPAPKPKPKPQKIEARRQANSGAMWHSKGDIVLEHALMECKERGTVNARGEKQITIPKEWLRKQEVEAFQEQKPFWYLPFGYKNDDAIYLVKPYEHELELIYELLKAREEAENLKEELEAIKNGR